MCAEQGRGDARSFSLPKKGAAGGFSWPGLASELVSGLGEGGGPGGGSVPAGGACGRGQRTAMSSMGTHFEESETGM